MLQLFLKIITYIGESTSALNLSLYGYPFKTTPWLDKQINKKNFIKFDQIFSTNTQSLGSLSAALSLCTFDDSEKCNGIYNLLNNLSVVDIISKAGVETNLYSLQSLFLLKDYLLHPFFLFLVFGMEEGQKIYYLDLLVHYLYYFQEQ